jgi:hypothetical protein
LHRLIDRCGGDGTIIDWLDELTADCPRKRAAAVRDQCHARCPDLPRAV